MSLESDLKAFWAVYEPYRRRVESAQEEAFTSDHPALPTDLSVLIEPRSMVIRTLDSAGWAVSWRTEDQDGIFGPYHLHDVFIPAGEGTSYSYTFSPIYERIGKGHIRFADAARQRREERSRGVYCSPLPDALLRFPRDSFATKGVSDESGWGHFRWVGEEHKGYFYPKREQKRAGEERWGCDRNIPASLLVEGSYTPQGMRDSSALLGKFCMFHIGVAGIDEFLKHVGAVYEKGVK